MRNPFLTTELPWPLDGGGKLRTFETLACLLPLGEVTVLGMTEEAGGEAASTLRAALPGLHVEAPVPWPIRIRRRPAALARTLLTSLTRGLPYLAAKFDAPAYRRRALELAAELRPDAVWCDHLNVFPTAEAAASSSGSLLVLDEHNVESDLFRSAAGAGGAMGLLARLEGARAERFERRAVTRARTVVAISESDAARLGALGGGDRVITVLPSAGPLGPPRAPPPARREVVMLGTLSWPPNAEAARFLACSVLPELRQRLPDVRVRIAGKGLSPTDARILRGAGAELEGAVADAEAFLRSGGAVAVPTLSGSGISMKTLDALRACVPLVTTTVGARGLPLRHGEEALVVDGAKAFAAALERALTDEELRRDLVRQGFAYLGRHHARQRLTQSYASIMGVASRPAHDQPGMC